MPKAKKKLVVLKPPRSTLSTRHRVLLQAKSRYLVMLDNRIDEWCEGAPIFSEGEVLTGTQILDRLNGLTREVLDELGENIDVQVMELNKDKVIRALQVWSIDNDSTYYVELMESDLEENGIMPPEGVKKLLIDILPGEEIPRIIASKVLDGYPGALSILKARLEGKL